MNMDDLPSVFEKAGLSEKEALVYSLLIKLGGAYPSRIAQETKLNRSTTYKVLLDLSIKGLINEIKKRNKIYYQVQKPIRFVRYIKDRIIIENENLKTVEKIIPDLEELYSVYGNKPKISYFENIDGLVAMYEDQIAAGKKYEMLSFANAAELEKTFPEKLFRNYRRTKEKIGITTRGIIPDGAQNTTFANRMYAGYKKEVIPKIKFIPASEFPFKGEIVIYEKNKVGIVNLNKEYLTGLIIEDETIHNMMKMIFEIAWKGIK